MPSRKDVEFWPGHPLSYTTTIIKTFFNETYLGPATGFVLRVGSMYGLVTNWHVVSGRNAITGACLSATAAVPNRIECHVAVDRKINRRDKKPSNELFFKPLDVVLYGDEGEQNWLDSREGQNQDDVAVIPLNPIVPELTKRNHTLRAIPGGRVTVRGNGSPMKRLQVDSIRHYYPPVGSEVFVLGYPRGITPSGIFPIWKRGSIASEPQVGLTLAGIEHESAFYIDALTKAGMSGSPVIFLGYGDDILHTDDGVRVTKEDWDPLFVGVYAGRDGVTHEEYELTLGRVWKSALVEHLFIKNAAKWARRNRPTSSV